MKKMLKCGKKLELLLALKLHSRVEKYLWILTPSFCSPDRIRGVSSRRFVHSRLFGESSSGVDFARFDPQSGEKQNDTTLFLKFINFKSLDQIQEGHH